MRDGPCRWTYFHENFYRTYFNFEWYKNFCLSKCRLIQFWVINIDGLWNSSMEFNFDSDVVDVTSYSFFSYLNTFYTFSRSKIKSKSIFKDKVAIKRVQISLTIAGYLNANGNFSVTVLLLQANRRAATLILVLGALCFTCHEKSRVCFSCVSFCKHFRSRQSVWSALFIIDVRDVHVLHAHRALDSRDNYHENSQ